MARCTKITQRGTRCASNALAGLKRCGRHTTSTRGKKKSTKKKSVKKAPKKKASKKKSSRKSPKYSPGKSINARYYQYWGETDAGNLSAKFWAGMVSGRKLITHHGRIGTKGKITTTTYSSPAAAREALAKRKASKSNKGYYRRRNPSLLDEYRSDFRYRRNPGLLDRWSDDDYDYPLWGNPG